MAKKENYEHLIDPLFKDVGSFGKFQMLTMLLLGFLSTVTSIMIYVTVFNLAEPEIICYADSSKNETFRNSDKTCPIWQNISESDNFKTHTSDFCELDKTYYSKTISSDWNLLCNRRFYAGLTQTIYLIGTVCTLFTGYFGDRFGRKPVIIFSLIMIGTSLLIFQILQLNSIGLNFTAKFVIYCISQFIAGTFANSLYVTCYVLMLEFTVHTRHTLFSNIQISSYVVGELVVLLFCFFIRDWEITNWIIVAYIFTAVVLSFFLLTESPRWMISVRKFQQAEKTFTMISKLNGKKTKIEINETDFLSSFVEEDKQIENDSSFMSYLKQIFSPYSNLKKFLLLACIWFSLNLLYYGVSLGITTIDSVNPYLIYLFSAFAELFGYMLCFINDRIGRKRSSFIYFILCGIVCITVAFVPRNSDVNNKQKLITDAITIIVLVSFGKAMASAAFNTVYVFTSEYYPTHIRNFVFMFICCIGNIGGFVSPQVNLSRTLWKPLPYIIFSSFSLIASLAVFLLPPIEKDSKINKVTAVSIKI